MFARVVPVLRTPFGVDGFDYVIPEDLTIQVSDLVRVPFRRLTVPALVVQIMTDSPFRAKAVPITGSYSSLRFSPSVVRLLAWTSARTFTSQPTVLKAWLRNLPKRFERRGSNDAARTTHDEQTARVTTYWTTSTDTHIVARAKELQAQGKHVLIVTPWITRLRRYKERIPDSVTLHNGLNDGDAFRSWTSWMRLPSTCMIATRLGAWLAPLADVVILDEPENDDHKQDELSPRYDTRLMLMWCAKNAGIDTHVFGRTPPLHVQTDAPPIDVSLTVNVRHPQGRSTIPMLQADTLNELRDHDGPRVIIHPIRGVAARLVCRDCGWRATCKDCAFPLSRETNHAKCKQCGKKDAVPLVCGSCGGADLGKSLPGIERLKAAWTKDEPDIPVEWRDLSNEAMDAPLPPHAFVAVTDSALLGGYSEDIRRRERQCIAFRRLADHVTSVEGRLIIQCEESACEQWEPWLTTEGVAAFQAREREERRLFGYPPAVRLVKIILSGDEANALKWKDGMAQFLPTSTEWRGPYRVPFRTEKQDERHIWHLLFPPGTSEEGLINQLTPLASSSIIDLDPIAFLR